MVLKRLLAGLLIACGGPAPAQAAPSPGEDLARRYVVREVSPAELQRNAPTLPDLRPYTKATVIAKIGSGPRGTVAPQRMVALPALGEFVSGSAVGRLREWAKRQSTNPVALVVSGGHMTVAQLDAALPDDQLQQVEPGVYVLRLPLLVDTDATLVIDRSVRELRLSQERGAFLVNDGRMFVVDSRLTAWSEARGAPAAYRDPEEFRPFLVSWGGAELYMAASTVTSFGYSASKAYGVSISQYSPGRQARLKRPPPRGWIIESEFVDNWFGFYCYEAEDLVIVGNTYRDNIVYGVDPHDWSHGLIIANNDISGTRKKHGLIISRAVNDSWIFNNRIYANALSGLVIDRNSVRNVIAGNVVFDNGSDGITVYESPDNLLWGNHAVGNGKHGIRVRNSVRMQLYNNRAIANTLAGIYGHVKDLRGTDRDLELDPFEQSVSMVVVGGQLVHNGSGPVSIDSPLSLELFDVDLLAPTGSTGIRLSGVLGQFQHRVLDLLVRKRLPVLIEPADAHES